MNAKVNIFTTNMITGYETQATNIQGNTEPVYAYILPNRPQRKRYKAAKMVLWPECLNNNVLVPRSLLLLKVKTFLYLLFPLKLANCISGLRISERAL